jgi:hypothetical protein
VSRRHVAGATAQAAGDDVGECKFRLIEEVVNCQADDEAGGRAGRIPGAGTAPGVSEPNVTAAWRSFRLRS